MESVTIFSATPKIDSGLATVFPINDVVHEIPKTNSRSRDSTALRGRGGGGGGGGGRGLFPRNSAEVRSTR